MNAQRLEIVQYLYDHAVGPFGGANEEIDDRAYRRYLMGTLYPRNASSEEMLTEEVEEAAQAAIGEEMADDPVTLANSWMPSSLGLSFYLAGAGRLRCLVWGARYEAGQSGRSNHWSRVVIAERSAPEQCEVVIPPGIGRSRDSIPVLEGRARLDFHWRPLGDGRLVTATLVNAQLQPDPDDVDAAKCLHQVGFECHPVGGEVREYPSVAFLVREHEEEEFRLLHRNARVFAIGHGCAAEWDSGTGATAGSVRTTLMPTYEVPALTHEGPRMSDVLRLSYLANDSISTTQLANSLTRFVDDYAAWVRALPSEHGDVPASLFAAQDRILARLGKTVARLRRGIHVLERDPQVLSAFRLGNLAMLMQMRHGEEDLSGTRRGRDQVQLELIDYQALEYTWRPFQLAFQLLTLSSVAYEDDEDREIVDLVWFPTGGGKTEAYLAVAALEIFLRRLRSGDVGAGTAVITRYTLRLLTSQQFQRAAAMVCAAELIRRDGAAQMGETPITIGLWVGNEVTPNRFTKAREKLEDVLDDPDPKNPFQLEQCPWCGTEIVPGRRSEDAAAYGIRATNTSFDFYCPTKACPFHDQLPISIVDEDLYERPPTILLATVDKFARLAWEERGGVFFGAAGHEPPSLIIQDEMHLLSGPLGTTVAVYEAAVEALAMYHGAKPKIIASTATIRRADDQVLGLFGRDVQLFPPPGLDAGDSYFARVDRSRRGRLYVGLMSQSHTPHTTIVHVGAALLQAPLEVVAATPAERDAYWTLVAYHNSLRELGRTITLARDDIPARIKIIARDQARMRELQDSSVVELTSNVGGELLPSILARLELPSTHPEAISLLASTNMLSVGVDVKRLGMMLVNGQPKSTSEYIQATSRVGRRAVPGLVVTVYVSTRPRDRSHYEGFIPYHAALYRHVEPTSVTPYSLPSRSRALHAAFVIMMRHGAGLSKNDDAGQFQVDDARTERVVDQLLKRVRGIDDDEVISTAHQLERICGEWDRLAAEARRGGRPLYYDASSRQHASLLRQFGSKGDGWETLNSMRSVDRQCTVELLGGTAP
jgi:hypothetical protein